MRQAWLLRHAYEPEMVPKKVFQLLLRLLQPLKRDLCLSVCSMVRYLAGLSGAARDRAVAEAGSSRSKTQQAASFSLLPGALVTLQGAEVPKAGQREKKAVRSHLGPLVQRLASG